MAMVVGGVAVDLTANAAQIIGEMNKAASAVQRAAGQMHTATSRWQTGFNTAERNINASLGRVGNGLRSLQGLIAAFGLGLGAREIIRYADAWKMAGAQIRLVSSSANQAVESQEELFAIAQNLGVSFDSLSVIYVRAARRADALGLSQEQVMETTEALGAAIKVSGASAQESSAALFQLSQTFARGVVRGEELNSISEQMPILLDAVATATGKTTTEVIKFATENGLAADLVVESIRRMRDEWVKQADQVGGTFEQSMQRVKDAIERTVGKAGDAGAFKPLTDGLDTLAAKLRSGETVNAIKSFFDEMDRRWKTTTQEAARFGYIITAVMEGRFRDALDAATGKLQEFEESYTRITREQALAVGAPIPLPRRPITQTPTRQQENLALRGGADAASAAKLARDIAAARESIADLIITSDEFLQIEQKLDNKARDLGDSFTAFKKVIKDSDDQTKALGRTLAALAVEEEAAAEKIADTMTELRQIITTSGLSGIDLGNQEIRSAVAELGKLSSANDKAFASKLALDTAAAKLGQTFRTLSKGMKEASEIDKLRGQTLTALAGAEEDAAKVAAESQEEALKNLQERYKDVTEASKMFATSFSEAATSAITGAQTIGEALRGLVQSLVEAVIQALIFKAVMAGLGTVGGGGLLGAIIPAPAVAGTRAMGGPVSAGSPYLVGERGPELFVPSHAGNVVPAAASGGRGGDNITIYADRLDPGAASRLLNIALARAPGAVLNARARGKVRGDRAAF